MSSKHTPGPWRLDTVKTSIGICHRIGEFPSRGRLQKNAACVYVDGAVPGHPDGIDFELEANARLIAAAPDLLAACRKAAALLASLSEDYSEEESDLYDAIVKAEGTPAAATEEKP